MVDYMLSALWNRAVSLCAYDVDCVMELISSAVTMQRIICQEV